MTAPLALPPADHRPAVPPALLALLQSPTNNTRQDDGQADRWLGADKLLHLLAGQTVAGGTLAVGGSEPAALAAALGAGLVREGGQYALHGIRPSVKDILATTAGALPPILWHHLQRRHPATTDAAALTPPDSLTPIASTEGRSYGPVR